MINQNNAVVCFDDNFICRCWICGKRIKVKNVINHKINNKRCNTKFNKIINRTKMYLENVE